jgi:hypothetical protein
VDNKPDVLPVLEKREDSAGRVLVIVLLVASVTKLVVVEVTELKMVDVITRVDSAGQSVTVGGQLVTVKNLVV